MFSADSRKKKLREKRDPQNSQNTSPNLKLTMYSLSFPNRLMSYLFPIMGNLWIPIEQNKSLNYDGIKYSK